MQEEIVVLLDHDLDLFTMKSIKFSNQYTLVTFSEALHFQGLYITRKLWCGNTLLI